MAKTPSPNSVKKASPAKASRSYKTKPAAEHQKSFSATAASAIVDLTNNYDDPSFENITPTTFAEIARAMFGKPNRNKNKCKTLDKEIQESLIGVSYQVCAELWNLIEPHKNPALSGYHPMHLLWALLFLKVYATLPVLSRLVGGVENAVFSYWSWRFVDAMSSLESKVIQWHNRWRGGWNRKSQCVTSLDTTDCAHKEMYHFNTKAYSHKFNGPGWKYEIAVGINTPDIVWVNGPFEGGRSDKTIFVEDGLKDALCPSE